MDERTKAIVTIIVTAVANIANIYGFAVNADAWVNVVLCIISALTIAYSWWKNQNVTEHAQMAQKYLDHLKAGGGELRGE